MLDRSQLHAIIGRMTIAFLLLGSAEVSVALASRHYTEKQLDALATRIGKTYWIKTNNGRSPSFLSAPRADAPSFQMESSSAFEITELTGRKSNDPYYKVKFDSGKEGYIRPEVFLEGFNDTILTVDPQADERRKQAAAAEEDKKRIAWIQAQPWSQAVKEAAIKRQPVPGMRTAEVKMAIGHPARVTKLKKAQSLVEERWFYTDRSVLIFQNGLLTRIERTPE